MLRRQSRTVRLVMVKSISIEFIYSQRGSYWEVHHCVLIRPLACVEWGSEVRANLALEMWFSMNEQMSGKTRGLEYVGLYEYCFEILHAMVMGAQLYPDLTGLANGCTQAFVAERSLGIPYSW